jgi:putative transposase
MARPLRIEFPEALYHVTSRGDRREDIYVDDVDREAWLAVLAQVCERFNWRVYAYCLMSNHYHLLVQTMEGNLSAGMRQLNGVFTQAVNRRHGRVGHVFQGRFKAILVDGESYLLELSRYVVLNPVRAGMVSDAGQWPWSSYAATMGFAPCPSWLAADALLIEFSSQRAAARRKYADHVRAGVGLPSVWVDLSGQIYLGDEKFVAKMQSKMMASAGDLAASDALDIPLAQRRRPRKPLAWFEEQFADRNAALAAAYASGAYKQVELARHFGLHSTTVSRLIAQAEKSA